ncbi:MAG TPA: acyl-CoA thioesterase [Lapillicoccus sp.]|jgi:acyl-CoA thioester hydrolase|nr:acyl-CoA thioesterase [Lapillicoccus sp.]
MSKAPIVYKSTHRIKFSELDPYDHVNTGNYATYYVDHRMEGLRDYAGWDLKTLGTLPFMMWVRRIEIDFLRPARGDQEITITSFVREFRGSDALIECTMTDSAGKDVSRCLMIVAHVDKETNRATDCPLTSWRYSSKKHLSRWLFGVGGVTLELLGFVRAS